jgi:hypothetical protein
VTARWKVEYPASLNSDNRDVHILFFEKDIDCNRFIKYLNSRGIKSEDIKLYSREVTVSDWELK